MTLQQLKYAVAVADSQNITEASKKVFISQPSLTSSIRELEEEMGITIFSRTNKGVTVTNEGDEFLSYARQVIEQAVLLEERYKGNSSVNPIFSVSCQHYSIAVNAFVDVIREYGSAGYDFTLRETQTHEIIEDVAHLKSELGVLYQSRKNEDVISKLLKKNNLQFEPLSPIDFECPKNIKVRDRATLFNLLIGLNGYTICSGVISHELNGKNIIARPLAVDDKMTVGIVTRKNIALSRYAESYIEAIKRHCS